MTSLQRTPATPSKPSRPTSRPSSKPPSRSPSICSRLQECYNTVQPDSVTEALRTDLDNKVGNDGKNIIFFVLEIRVESSPFHDRFDGRELTSTLASKHTCPVMFFSTCLLNCAHECTKI